MAYNRFQNKTNLKISLLSLLTEDKLMRIVFTYMTYNSMILNPRYIEARITHLYTCKGVTIDLLDLSSQTRTKTFKDTIAEMTIDYCNKHSIRNFIFQSSGNTANALNAYAQDHKIRTVMLYPRTSRYKLDPSFINCNLCTSIECDIPEPQIKQLTSKLSKLLALPLLPNYNLQIQANKARSYYLFNYYLKNGYQHNWHVQSLSSAYGIFGLYEGFRDLAPELAQSNYVLPKLLGVQQAAVSPYVKRTNGRTSSETKIIEPTLFRSQPTEKMLRDMELILAKYGGVIESLTCEEYQMHENQAIKLLESCGITIGRKKHRIIEKSGLIAIAGVLRAVNSGIIKKGETVLVAFTGGTRQSVENFTPTFSTNNANVDHLTARIINHLSLSHA